MSGEHRLNMTVFLSYAHEDVELVYRLRQDLLQYGVSCWLDKEELLPGQRWREEIDDAIHNCAHFIALLSRNSIAKTGFAQRELRIALDVLAEMPPGRIFLI